MTNEITHTSDTDYMPLPINRAHAGSSTPAMRPSSRKRRDSIINAARELYETQGYAHTNIQDITRHIDLTRSLFYHYFADKEAVTQAVLDSYIDEYIERFKTAVTQSEHVHIEDVLAEAVYTAYLPQLHTNKFICELHDKVNAALYGDLINRSAQRSADLVLQTLDGAEMPDSLRAIHTFERYYIFFLGLFSYFKYYPDVDEATVHQLIDRALPFQKRK